MLFRCMIIMLLLIVSTMPAWANDKKPMLSETVKHLMDSGYDLADDDILSTLHIETKDWLEGDTYYISYTFTNPTNTPLQKKIDFVTVTYDLCHTDDPYRSITRYTKAIPAFDLPPYTSSGATISLKQPISVSFNHLTSCTFFFEDNTSLCYNTLGKSANTSPFRLTPVISPFGDVSLTIQNTSPSETITELRDIRLNFTIGHEPHKMILTDPITLEIKPNESHTLPLFTLPSATNTTSSSAFSLNAKTANATENNNYHINMKINGIPHTYSDNYTNALRVSGSIQNTFIDTPETTYQPAPLKLDPKNGAFYLDDSHLYGYVTVKNTSATTVSSSNISYRITLPYFDQNAQYQEQRFSIHLPQDFSLPAHKSNYYAFKIPLPTDFQKFHTYHDITFQPINNRSLTQTKLAQVTNASAVPKENYTILTDVEIEK